jgi:hypothetical protein
MLLVSKQASLLLQLAVIKTTTPSTDDDKAYTLFYDTLFFSFLPAPGKRNLAESLYWGKRGKHEQFRIFYLLSEKIENCR